MFGILATGIGSRSERVKFIFPIGIGFDPSPDVSMSFSPAGFVPAGGINTSLIGVINIKDDITRGGFPIAFVNGTGEQHFWTGVAKVR
jgi:hypothetical protein